MSKIILNGETLSVSSDNSGDLKIKFLICPLDVINSNKIGIKESDITDEEKVGLKNKAVVTKVVKNKNGDYDFSGHNMKTKNIINEDGQLVKEYEFDTSAVGFHQDVYVEELEINGVKKNCIIGEAIIWSRFPKVIEVIERLGTKLRTSWEIIYGDSYKDTRGNTWIKDLDWLGNCMLSSNIRPAYANAGALEIAEEDSQELDLIMAISEDMFNNSDNESDINININKEKGGMTMSDVALSTISLDDLEGKIRKAIYSTETDGRYYWGVLVYPYEFKAYAKVGGQGSSVEDYVLFNYTVNSDDTISITSQEDMKMVFMPKVELDTKVNEATVSIAEKEVEIASKVEEIVNLGGIIKEKEVVIAEKETEIANLLPFKEKVELAEAEAKELELSEAREVLKAKAINSKYVTEDEIATSEELKQAIIDLDEKYVNGYIGQKVLAYASDLANKEKDVVEEKTIAISEKIEKKNIKINIFSENKLEENNEIFKFINKK